MSLMAIFITASIIGLGLVSFTVFLGGDSDADTDMEVDADVDVDADADGGDAHDHGGLDFLGWLPILSLRFWTFFLTAFGLVGVGCRVAHLPTVVSLPVAGVAGYLSGWGFVSLFRRINRSSSDSSLGEQDIVGAHGTVILPVAKGRTGKVRLQLKGRTIELLAETDDVDPIAEKQTVIVYGINDEGNALVERQTQLPE